jgi:gluconolactonase
LIERIDMTWDQDVRAKARDVSVVWLAAILVGAAGVSIAQQPSIGASEGEPTLPALLAKLWQLDADKDLRNPLIEGAESACLFQRLDPKKPVVCEPALALGMDKTATHVGWYAAGPRPDDVPKDVAAKKQKLWSYTYRHPESECKTLRFGKVPLADGAKTTFDPGDKPFGLWASNEAFDDGGVFTQPAAVKAMNKRLAGQPYKAMIYPYFDTEKKKIDTTKYLVCFEYSTNDDFQDAIVLLGNVRLLPGEPALPGVLAPGAKVGKLAGEFKFTEGPAWSRERKALFFSDIPNNRIIRYADGKATVANPAVGFSNGLMFDAGGRLIACEHNGTAEVRGGRRVSARKDPSGPGKTLAKEYEGKPLNSPNDLWIDADGGVYFTDPRYGPRNDMKLDKEAVYYVARDGGITRITDALVKPNGIALAPDGRFLYVVDNGAHSLWRFPVLGPGKVGRGKRIAWVSGPDGMSVDREGRLYVAGARGVWVLDRDGKWLGLIETPEQPANCTFGGQRWRTLFITARTSLYGIETTTRGWHVHLDGVPPVSR